MKFFLALALIFWTFFPASELDRLVNELQAKYVNLNSIAADFTQVYTSPGERSRRENGRLQLKKPGKMRWDYLSPESKLYVSDGKVIYEYIVADRLATRTAVKESGDWRNPFMFLLGRGNLRRDFSRIEFSSEAPIKAENRVLRLIPKRATDFRELILEVEPKSLQLTRVSFVKSGNVRIDFLLSNVRENVALTDDIFNFKAPPGVTIRQR